MSNEKPTYKELSAFGQCVVDKHFANALAHTAQKNKPSVTASAEDKKHHAELVAIIASRETAMKDIVLDTIGIDAVLSNSELVQACSNKIPPNTPDLKKAARAQRT